MGLLKYGYSNFRAYYPLLLLEKKTTFWRKNNRLEKSSPEYNVLKRAGSPIGYKHTEEARAKMRGAREMSEEHRKKVREHLSVLNACKGIKVEVHDLTKNATVIYPSLSKAAEALKCYTNSLVSYEKTKLKALQKGKNKLFRKRYNITIIRDK